MSCGHPFGHPPTMLIPQTVDPTPYSLVAPGRLTAGWHSPSTGNERRPLSAMSAQGRRTMSRLRPTAEHDIALPVSCHTPTCVPSSEGRGPYILPDLAAVLCGPRGEQSSTYVLMNGPSASTFAGVLRRGHSLPPPAHALYAQTSI